MTEKDIFMVRCEVEGIRSNLEKLSMTRKPVEYWFLRGRPEGIASAFMIMPWHFKTWKDRDLGRLEFPGVRFLGAAFSGKEKRNNNMMNFIAVMCVFVGGYGVRWLCEIMQEED